jgi:hypothetical protein
MGVEDGMDVLTLSLAIDDGWSSSTFARVVDGIVNATGMIITASAGNGGDSGVWCIGDPATGKEVIAVGSVDKSVLWILI